jgi:hypothetical protein
VPNDVAKWNRRSITEIIDFIDRSLPDPDQFETTRSVVDEDPPVRRARDPGRARDDRADPAGVLRFRPRSQVHELPRAARYYPNLRKLLLERDLTGKQLNYLASEDDFQYLKSLEARNLVIPVVGNLAGPHALREIGRVLSERNEKLSVLYVSNVEFYLMREGSFDAFAASVRTLPFNAHSVIIRSYFGGGFYGSHPQSVPGYFSTQLLQTVDTFASEVARGGYAPYQDLVLKHFEQLSRSRQPSAISSAGGHMDQLATCYRQD